MCWSWTGRVLVTLWALTGWSFIVYLVYFYLANPEGDWNRLPDLNGPQEKPLIYLHAVGATIILLLGPFQMLNQVYRMRVHRWTGVVYALGCTLASLGGLGFIVLNGTTGGVWMTFAFSVSGILTFLFTLITVYFAVRGLLPYHRAWAIRLYVLASTSVFYRLLYFGIYPLIFKVWGPLHSRDFQAPLDIVFDWIYFLLPMILAEVYLRIRSRRFYCFPLRRAPDPEVETFITV